MRDTGNQSVGGAGTGRKHTRAGSEASKIREEVSNLKIKIKQETRNRRYETMKT